MVNKLILRMAFWGLSFKVQKTLGGGLGGQNRTLYSPHNIDGFLPFRQLFLILLHIFWMLKQLAPDWSDLLAPGPPPLD